MNIGVFLQEFDDSKVYNIDNVKDYEERLIYNQEITQNLMLPKSSSPQNYHCSTSQENNPPEENNDSSTNVKITEVETIITPTANTSHISPISNSDTIKKGVKRTSAALRYDKSIEQTEKLATISQKDYEIRQWYYTKKLKLYETELALKERDVIAKEKICTLLEQFLEKNN